MSASLTPIPTTETTSVPTGSVTEVLRVAWPLLVSMLGHTLMGLVDMLMVAGVHETALSAVGLAHTVTLVPLCAGMGFLYGVRVAVAQATGAGDAPRARLAVRQGAFIALGIGGLVLFAIPFARVLHEVLGAGSLATDGSGLELATQWFSIRMLGFPFQFLAIALLAGFDGRGQTQISMRVNISANVLNILLCLLLVDGLGPVPALGVAGSAWATVLSNVLQVSAAAWLWRRHLKMLGPASGDARAMRREVARLGGPTSLQWTLEVLSWTLLTGFIAGYGNSQMAAHAMTARICSLSFMPGHAIGEAVSILVGQAVGAGTEALARRAYRSGLFIAIVMMGTIGLLFVAWPDVLLNGFHPSDGARQIARDLLILAAVLQVFDAVVLVAQGALNGAGDTRFTMANGIIMTWAFWIPVSWYFVVWDGRGAVGAWASLVTHVAGMAMMCALRWRSGTPLRVALLRPPPLGPVGAT